MDNVDRIVEIVELATKVVAFVISLIATFAASKLPTKWQEEAQVAILQREQKWRDALHSAARSGVEAGKISGLSGTQLLTFALSHMIKSVPDAIVGLTPTTKEVLQSGPAETVLNKIPGPVRNVLENIVASKIDPVLDKVRNNGWTAPNVPTASGLPPPR